MFLTAMFAATIMMADVTPAAAAAATAPATPATAAAPAKTEKPKVICKSEVVVGSLMPKKTCYTVDQAAQRKQDERADLEKMQTSH